MPYEEAVETPSSPRSSATRLRPRIAAVNRRMCVALSTRVSRASAPITSTSFSCIPLIRVTPIADTLGALDELVRAGKVREIGCSNFSVEQLHEAERAVEPGTRRDS